VGLHCVNINSDKAFDDDAEWNYLGALLSTKVNEGISEKIKNAHQKLSLLFQHIKTDANIIYPFKYDCETGAFLYPELEKNCGKMLHKAMVKQEPLASQSLFLGVSQKYF